jgi:acyl carrier protein
MDELEERLAACFSSVLPDLGPDEIRNASATTVASWDSVATVTLLAVVEEEFGISISDEDPSRFDSFSNILSYLKQVAN